MKIQYFSIIYITNVPKIYISIMIFNDHFSCLKKVSCLMVSLLTCITFLITSLYKDTLRKKGSYTNKKYIVNQTKIYLGQ